MIEHIVSQIVAFGQSNSTVIGVVIGVVTVLVSWSNTSSHRPNYHNTKR
jgi:hypothetical protein